MNVWGDKIKVVDTRRMTHLEYVEWIDRHKSSHFNIHAELWADINAWMALPPWVKDWARILAVGTRTRSGVICGRSAARLWGIQILGYEKPVVVCLPGSKTPPRSRNRWIHYRSAKVPADKVVEHKGIRFTSMERSVADTCRWGDFAEGLVAVESYLRHQDGHRFLLMRELEHLGRLPGVRKLRRVMEAANSKSESVAESWAKAQLIEARIPFEQQARIDDRRVDFLIEGIIVEIDGDSKFKEAESVAVLHERKRDRELQNAGYPVAHFDWNALKEGTFIPDLRRLLESMNSKTPRVPKSS
ncbi:hypothetical protein WG915_10935 [Corynebacterium sp. H128]|uniref:hypothetical protein n=1 Tax=Corynebacterium sp. H128 TaxID=3133427 RepID=UPI0030B0EB9E